VTDVSGNWKCCRPCSTPGMTSHNGTPRYSHKTFLHPVVLCNCEVYVSNHFFGFMGVTFPLPRLTDKNRGTLVIQNNARLPQGLLLRCSKTTTSESLIDQRVFLNEHVWAEVDRRRKPQRENVHIKAGGVHCWNEP